MIEDSWYSYLELLKEYRSEKPDLWPRSTEKFRNVKLGAWCYKQRFNLKKGKLDSTKESLLNDIGFPWEQIDSWKMKYKLLELYREENPNSWPTAQEKFKGEKLGIWCASQRTKYRNDKLRNDRIELLNSIEFLWEQEDQWTPKYELLLEFRSINQDQWPSGKTNLKGKIWANGVLRKTKYKNGKLIEKQTDLLNSIGFPWKQEDTWYSHFELLEKYRIEFPDKWPTTKEKYCDVSIGSWCSTQGVIIIMVT